MVLTIIEFWHYLIDSFGNYAALLYMTWYLVLFEHFLETHSHASRSLKVSCYCIRTVALIMVP
jgi:hypothetical protein